MYARLPSHVAEERNSNEKPLKLKEEIRRKTEKMSALIPKGGAEL